jgi:molecular chaperone DnaJ
VAPSANADDIRAAYRERARHAHPDRGAASSESMVALNEAYRVLADPGRRAVYDRSLLTPTETGAADGDDLLDRMDSVVVADKPNPLSPAGPARVPWRLMLAVAAIGSAVVLISSLFDDPPQEEAPDGILSPGSCVAFETNGDVREVACGGGEDDIVVEVLVPLDGICPSGTVGHRDRLGLGLACVPM